MGHYTVYCNIHYIIHRGPSGLAVTGFFFKETYPPCLMYILLNTVHEALLYIVYMWMTQC